MKKIFAIIIFSLLVIGYWSLVITAQAVAAPTITIYTDGVTLSAGTTVRRLPIISAKISDATGINKMTISLTIDGGIKTFTISPTTEGQTSYEATYTVTSALDKGSHIIQVSANNLGAETSTSTFSVSVLGTVTVTGNAMNYPNPFKPLHGETTKITYTLTDDGDTSINIYDLNGNMVKRLTGTAGAQDSAGVGLGGRQGYNEVSWNGNTDFGSQVGNGAYPYIIIYQGKVIKYGQIAVYD
ncbi:hypothetical protein HZC34_06405 [Candidatus Saganbacteria bacterium]|nr:hypothetical protein [Candidatus Saganbacteria bacterium]